ncbi:MAG: hypothetical protein J6Q76_02715 [Clostridia bacterium]|nr:hypothetical protein [Clostridia bacterium]
MKIYQKPKLNVENLQTKESIASVVPTLPDYDNDEIEMSNSWGDQQYWD